MGRVTVPGGGSDPLARIIEKVAAFDTDGFELCCDSCPLSYAEITALASELAAVRGRLAETEANGETWRQSMYALEERVAALRVERDTARKALRDIAAIKPDAIQWVEHNHVRLQTAVRVAREALAAVGGPTAP